MHVWSENDNFLVRNTELNDFAAIEELCRSVYPFSPAWSPEQLASHHKVFPEGQFVAVEKSTHKIVGMASSLIIFWDDYEFDQNWIDFTDRGFFTNHDPSKGKTLYGAEVMTHPDYRGRKVGALLYEARRELVRKLGLKRIRAGARMRGYATYSEEMSAEEYAEKVSQKKLFDPTVSFQLKQGFKIIGVVSNYLRFDPESKGFAAIIEWKSETNS